MNANSTEASGSSALIEQYKLYVEMMDRISLRRQDASKFYVSLLTAVLAILALVIERNTFMEFRSVVFLSIALVGILSCAVWFVNIRSYRQINSLKFQVIHEMETYLPFQCYKREWEILQSGTKRYRRLSQVEQYIPLVFSIPYCLLLIYAIVGLLR